MMLYFLIIFSMYFIFLLILLYGWNRSISQPLSTSSVSNPLFISVIVAVRNEDENILRLLNCLSLQSYPKEKYEVIIVDDYSTDHTVSKIQGFKKSQNFNLRLLKSEHKNLKEITPKKAALQQGIDAAKGDVIMMTDGDCWFGEDWIKSFSLAFYNDSIKFVAGIVAIEGNITMLSKIQSIEFSSLIGTGGALINLNYPLMCNGANLAFRKEVFYEVDGYLGYENNSSGDDVFLMQKINNNYKNSIAFINDHRAVVYTFPQPSFSTLLHQRKRWASKWHKYPLVFSWLIPVFLFIHYLSFIAIILMAIISVQFMSLAVSLIMVKIILDGVFLRKVMKICKLKFEFFTFLLSEVIYPFYAIIVGISVQFGKYEWKGRSYKI